LDCSAFDKSILAINIKFTFTLNIEVKLSIVEIFPIDVFFINNIISLVFSFTPFNDTVYIIIIRILYIERTKNDIVVAI